MTLLPRVMVMPSSVRTASAAATFSVRAARLKARSPAVALLPLGVIVIAFAAPISDLTTSEKAFVPVATTEAETPSRSSSAAAMSDIVSPALTVRVVAAAPPTLT